MSRQMTVMTVDKPGPLLNMNDRVHYMTEARNKALWRDAAFWWAKQHRLMCRGAVGQVEVWIEFGTKLPNKRRDPHNFTLTTKAICDGFTHACVWEDDDSKHVKTYEPTFTEAVADTQLRITLSWEDNK